ncbi:MAG: hypothetical protein JO055_18625 [Alphaproteobacteria bacterium]|nr:hypothetical protein [Alphaproteobacteria bacterium]
MTTRDPLDPEPLPNGKLSYSRHAQMVMPDNSPNVRTVEFRLPRFSDTPTVSVQIIASAGATLMAASALKINDNVSGTTQISVSAQSIDNGPAAGLYWCNIVVIATPI